MIELIFGIIWTVITILFTTVWISENKSIDIAAIPFFTIFLLQGIFLLVKGLKKVIKNKKNRKIRSRMFCYDRRYLSNWYLYEYGRKS